MQDRAFPDAGGGSTLPGAIGAKTSASSAAGENSPLEADAN
jgi:hypothetical protein